ncbi:hypothetical protein [Pelosinus propionicus]|uniref:Uncharacterized protein n=1 Tax=Pelosinus propionicus DSM 13327 TaxID=1123291 RepID=A0A1I4LFA6_9FIRM|nr:hypothetical protein [Pelosinus propionicus]SFL89503.1 hypothetical protein SAMN04490355_102435 [Pelosinus propionicus DSM 13327]
MSDEILDIEMSKDEIEQLIMDLPRILKDLEQMTIESTRKVK